jgi:hypothetical protein
VFFDIYIYIYIYVYRERAFSYMYIEREREMESLVQTCIDLSILLSINLSKYLTICVKLCIDVLHRASGSIACSSYRQVRNSIPSSKIRLPGSRILGAPTGNSSSDFRSQFLQLQIWNSYREQRVGMIKIPPRMASSWSSWARLVTSWRQFVSNLAQVEVPEWRRKCGRRRIGGG